MNAYKIHHDSRGNLIPIGFDTLPFVAKRVFVVNSVPANTKRGGHAHKECEQLLVCLSGCIHVTTITPREQESHILYEGHTCYIGRFVWAEQEFVERNSTLLVFCSHDYDANDYITDKTELNKLL